MSTVGRMLGRLKDSHEMGLFGPKKISYVGADIGAGGMKLVELQNEKGRARLLTYGFTERPVDAEPTNLIDSPKEAAALLKKIWQKARMSTNKTVAGLPVSAVFSSVITVPKGNDKEIAEAVRNQARKLIPVPLEEMVTDHKVIGAGTGAKPGSVPGALSGVGPSAAAADKVAKATDSKDKKDDAKTVQVLLTGASKAMVQKYVTVFKLAGLDLVSIETEAFALIRSLIGKDRATTMIVDMGAVRTNIVIVDGGVPYVARSLDMGGATLTKAMAKALSMDAMAAEHMKCDIKSISSVYPGDGLPRMFETAIAPMVTELRYSMNLYLGQSEGFGAGKSVEKIILTGGSAALPALAPYFAKQLGIKSYVGDPWARVVAPEGLRPVLDEVGPRFAVSLGLAMRDIE
jgi:type IV pilus assembly protein PilM